jgi:pentatricopeptide repeat protein
VHFIVHAYDYPALAHKGVASARKYSKLAAAAPHALHMPSHIYTRTGYWQDSVDTNIAAAKTCNEDRCKLHSYDYMVYAYLQMGKTKEATEIVDQMRVFGEKTIEDRFVAPMRSPLHRCDWRSRPASGSPPPASPCPRRPPTRGPDRVARR